MPFGMKYFLFLIFFGYIIGENTVVTGEIFHVDESFSVGIGIGNHDDVFFKRSIEIAAIGVIVYPLGIDADIQDSFGFVCIGMRHGFLGNRND